ncbi:hypothetical protein GCM10017559_49350 [Streptosporangium longisporum]|uniref:Uncharacterized protein n=1 Tax=Streptosporangium longisporum TaxID=46187 RepID=A0ABN3Y5T0_9ACTN
MPFLGELADRLADDALSYTVLGGQVLTRGQAGSRGKFAGDDLPPDEGDELKVPGLIHSTRLTSGYPACKLVIRLASRIAGSLFPWW